MFRWEDNEIYDEFLDFFPSITLNTGVELACLIGNCFSFLIKDLTVTGEEITPVYRCRQVKADKRVGSGEDIARGQRLFAYRKDSNIPWTTPQDCEVSPNAVGTPGTDYMFCGWAKESVDADDEYVLMNFDGTRPEIGY